MSSYVLVRDERALKSSVVVHDGVGVGDGEKEMSGEDTGNGDNDRVGANEWVPVGEATDDADTELVTVVDWL